MPLISVVTVVRNDRRGLARTLASVQSQDYRGFEHVIVDGASSDGTRELLQASSGRIARWVSEPDQGIADAFNKGIALARGEWIQFLNADDRLEASDTLARVAARLGPPGVVTGFSRFGSKTIPKRPLSNHDPLRLRALISQQASFVHRTVFERCGVFDPSFRVRMDYEFWLRALPHCSLAFLEEVLADFTPGGQSGRLLRDFHREENRANRMHLRHSHLANLRTQLRFLRLSLARARDKPREVG